MRRRTAPRRRGTMLLPLAVACLLGSAGLRLAGTTGQALAEEVAVLLPVAAATPDGAFCPDDAQLNDLVLTLTARERKVTAAETALSTREAALAATEARLSTRLAELKSAEEKLAATMARTASAAEDDVSRLVAVYEAMKPKDAVPLFEAMAPDFAAGFLGRMRPEAAAAILAGMAPERAYAVSAVLAGRNARVPVPAQRDPGAEDAG